MHPPLKVDFAVIGGGSAGYAAARTAVSLGLTTVVIDGADPLGGLCILRGCMPSKALIASGNRNLTIRRAAEFGLTATAGAPDIKAVRDRKRLLIGDFAGYRQGQLGSGKFELIRGNAVFTGTHTLNVSLNADNSHRVIEFKTACIATGSVVQIPPMPGLQETGYWTSDDVLDTDALPASIIVLGGGAIALEMAHYLEAMGRKVTLIQRSKHVLTSMDTACGEVVVEAFRKRGIEVFCGTRVHKVERTADGKRVSFSGSGSDTEHVVTADEILVATGRKPNTGKLGLDAASVATDGDKIRVTSEMQTTQPHIFAAGDVCSPLDVVHIAIQQGETAAQNAASLIKDAALEKTMDYRLRLFGVFCQPEVACVGATEAELQQNGIPYRTASYPFNDHGKSMVGGETDGFVALLAHQESGEILGGSVVGPEATELIHEITVAMHFKSTAKQLAAIPHYHPTLSEIWTYPAEELAEG